MNIESFEAPSVEDYMKKAYFIWCSTFTWHEKQALQMNVTPEQADIVLDLIKASWWEKLHEDFAGIPVPDSKKDPFMYLAGELGLLGEIGEIDHFQLPMFYPFNDV